MKNLEEIKLLRKIAHLAWQLRTTESEESAIKKAAVGVVLDSSLSDYRHEFGFRKIEE